MGSFGASPRLGLGSLRQGCGIPAGSGGRGSDTGCWQESGLELWTRGLRVAAHGSALHRMQGAGKALHELLLSAQRQGCLTAGVYESAKVLNV